MKIVVVGHLVLDELHLFDGNVVESFGGIYFAIGAFAAISSQNDSVIPIFPFGNDMQERLNERIRRLRHISSDGMYALPVPTTRVKLFYDTQTSYNTCLVTELPPIQYEKFIPYLDADLMYLNMMTASDITLETAEAVRLNTPALLYLDTHMLAYRVAGEGSRHLQPQQDWKRWCAIADVVQMNEREIANFIEPGLQERTAVRKILDSGRTKHVVITRGEFGATVYSRDKQDIQRIEIGVVPVDRLADTTGCGDSFGSAFAYKIALGCSLGECGNFAALVASHFATCYGSEGIEQLVIG